MTENRTLPEQYTNFRDHGLVRGLFGGWSRSYYYQELPTPLTVKAAYGTVYQTDTDQRPVFSFVHATRYGATHYIPEKRPDLIIRRPLKSWLREKTRKPQGTAEAEQGVQLTAEQVIDAAVRDIMAGAEGVRMYVRPPERRNGYYSLVKQTDNVTRVHGALYRAIHGRQQAPETSERTRPVTPRRRPSPRPRRPLTS